MRAVCRRRQVFAAGRYRAEGRNPVQKALLISILVASALIPLRAARASDPVRGLRRAVLGVFGFEVAYLIGLLFLYPRL
jgi:hypothetical protein